MKNLIWVGVIGFLAYSFLRKAKNTLDALRFKVAGIQLVPVYEVAGPSVVVNIAVTNTTPDALSVNEVAGMLYVNNTVIGHAVGKFFRQVPGMQSVVIPVQIAVSGSGVYDVVRGFIENKTIQNAIFVFDGTVNYSGINVPVKLEYKFAL